MPKLVVKILLHFFLALAMCDCIVCKNLFAQDNHYSILPITPVNGIASSDITSISQDSKKKLWIAHSAGISDYDGYSFNNYLFSGDVRLGRGYAILEDSAYGYFVGAESGLFILKDHEMKFISFTGKSIPVYSFAKMKNGDTWLATSEGPAFFTAEKFRHAVQSGKIDISTHIISSWKKKFTKSNTSKCIVIDDRQKVYISDGYTIYSPVADSLEVSWQNNVKADAVMSMACREGGQLYFATVFTGLHMLQNKKVEDFTEFLGNGNAVTVKDGEVFYFATSGIYRIDQQKRVAIPEILLPEELHEWGSYVFRDAENNFWIGTHEKLLHARRRLFSELIQNKMTGFDELYSIKEMKDGELLAGGNHGRLFGRRPGEKNFTPREKLFERASVSDILADDAGNKWFGSGFQGIMLWSKKRKTLFTMKDGLRDNTNLVLLYTSKKELYAAGDNGISRMDLMENDKVSFKNFKSHGSSNNYAVFKSAIESRTGKLLFGSNYGLYEISKDSLVQVNIKKSSRKNHFVTNIATDKNGLVWISTIGDGIMICEYNKAGELELKQQITEKDGLSSMLYLNMIIDKNNICWAISYSGISRVERNSNDDYGITNFSGVHGFINDNYHSAKLYQDNSGIIWVLTSSGLFNFHPDDALNFIRTSPVNISRVESGKGNKMNNYLLSSDVSQQAEFSYNKNDLGFNFNSINLSEPSATKYRYRLLGMDSNWTDAGRNRQVQFRNLKPGEYRFEVKASNGTSTWSMADGFNFIIRPPFWATWWFITGIAAAASFLIFYFIKVRVRKIKKIEGEKMEIEKLRTISYQYQLEIEQVINYFATSISEQRTVDDILWDIARNCISKLGFEDCVIYLKDETGNVLIQKAAWGPKTTHENRILNPIEIPIGHGIVGSVAVSGKPLIISDTSADTRYIVDDAHRFSEITVPIINEGRVIGVIDSEYPDKNFYTNRHLHILTTIASLCAEKMSKVKSAQQAMEKEVEVFKLNQDLATSQLTALRSQMNPHFIFNSLNSIAQLVASQKNEEGLEYLNKFSKLMRLVLDESGNELITLKDEKRMLDLYLQLETLRFGSSFSHSIHTSEDLDEEDTLLPSFIIHPIVENAVWHGLLHKEGQRRLIIDFMKKGNDQLICIVKDNGIGIMAAREKKEERLNGEKRESKGLQIIRDRLNLLQKQYKVETSLKLEDLEENNIITGTKVTIQLPVIYE